MTTTLWIELTDVASEQLLGGGSYSKCYYPVYEPPKSKDCYSYKEDKKHDHKHDHKYDRKHDRKHDWGGHYVKHKTYDSKWKCY